MNKQPFELNLEQVEQLFLNKTLELITESGPCTIIIYPYLGELRETRINKNPATILNDPYDGSGLMAYFPEKEETVRDKFEFLTWR